MQFYRDMFKMFRESKQRTLAEVGKAIGVSKQTVCKWESGTTTPRPSNVYAVAKFLGISAVDISDLKPEEWLTSKPDEIIPDDGFFKIILKAWGSLDMEQRSEVALLAAEMEKQNQEVPPSTSTKMA